MGFWGSCHGLHGDVIEDTTIAPGLGLDHAAVDAASDLVLGNCVSGKMRGGICIYGGFIHRCCDWECYRSTCFRIRFIELFRIKTAIAFVILSYVATDDVHWGVGITQFVGFASDGVFNAECTPFE